MKNQFAVCTVERYIKTHHGGNQADFARFYGVAKQQVTRWIKCGAVFGDGSVFIPKRRKLDR